MIGDLRLRLLRGAVLLGLALPAAGAPEFHAANLALDPPRPFVNQPFSLQLDIVVSPGTELQSPELRGLPGGTQLELGPLNTQPPTRTTRDGVAVEIHRFRSEGRATTAIDTAVQPLLAFLLVERRAVGFFTSWQSTRRQLQLPPARIEIRPLPETGRPAGFAGAIGEFTLSGRVEPAVVVPMDIVNLTVEVVGKGTLGEARPQLPALDPARFKVYPPTETRAGPARLTLSQAIIPQSTQAVEVAAARFTFFDTAREQYRTITAGPFALAFTTRRADDTPAVRQVEVSAPRPAGTRQELPAEVSMYRELRRVIPLAAGLLAALGFMAIFRPTHRRLSLAAGLMILGGVAWSTHAWIGRERVVRVPLRQTVALRIAPGERAHSSIELPEGTPVRLLARGEGWLRIEAGGHRGWIPAAALSPDD